MSWKQSCNRFALPLFLLIVSMVWNSACSADTPVIDYTRYGSFEDVGTTSFTYNISDSDGLKALLAPGIFPHTGHPDDPDFKAFMDRNPQVDSVWKFSGTEDFLWALILDRELDSGLRQYLIAEEYRLRGMYHEAVHAYYSTIIHFSKSVQWSKRKEFYWHIAPEALARIRKICALHPELGYQLEDAFVDAVKSQDRDPETDTVKVWPGVFKVSSDSRLSSASAAKGETAELGGSYTRVVKNTAGQWQMYVEDKPFTVKGISYHCSKIGETPHDGSLRTWMNLDDDGNGQNDCLFDSWIDGNNDGLRQENERVVGDAKLLQDAGVNAIRYYHVTGDKGEYDPTQYNKPLMRNLFENYGIRFIMGDFLGAYTLGSGADWNQGTDYSDAVQRKRMLESVERMVRDHKDEPYVLMWLLGNENQHPHTRTNAVDIPDEYAKFVNEAAILIKRIDPSRPVAVCNLNSEGARELARYAPNIDIYGANVYSGAYSMGSVYQIVKRFYDRPILFTEWGCDAYHNKNGEDQDGQSDYLTQNWEDIRMNMAGGVGEGNAIGGIVFEWMDEWWKSRKDAASVQSTMPDMSFPFPDGWSHEEWFGLVSQGQGTDSPSLRVLRKSYYTIRDLWNPGPYIYLTGVIQILDKEQGTFSIIGGEVDKWDEESPGAIYKLQTDPETVEVLNAHNQDLNFNLLQAGDNIDVDLDRQTREVIEIFFNGYRRGLDEQ